MTEMLGPHLYLKYLESNLKYAFCSLYLQFWKIIYMSPLGSLGKFGWSFSREVAILRINFVGYEFVIIFNYYNIPTNIKYFLHNFCS